MTNPCEIVEEHGFLSDAFKFEIEKTITELGHIVDAMTVTRVWLVSETGSFSDSAFGNRSYTVAESGSFSDAVLLPRETFTIRESGDLSDKLTTRRTLIVFDGAALNDALTVGLKKTVSEHGTIRDTITVGGRHTQLVSESGVIHDAIFYRRKDTITESGNLGDALRVHRSITVAESGNLGDVQFSGSRHNGVVTEQGVIHDTAFGVLHATMTVREAGCITDVIVMPAANAAWTAPTKTFGMSQYNNWPINSLFRCDGHLVGLGDSGAYVMKSTKDAGANFLARVRTDMDDFQSKQKKRAGYVYATYKSDGNIRVRVTVNMAGVTEAYAYDFEQRTATVFTPGRAKMGRGLDSQVYTLAFENINGSTLAMSAASVVTDQTSRKV